MTVVSPWEYAARRFEPRTRRWANPGAMATELDPAYRTTAALDLIDAELEQIADGSNDRLMVFLPPQEGKSQKISRRFPAWLLEHDPTLRIAIVSYAADKAVRWGRQIRRDVLTHTQLGIELRADSRAAGRWETTQGGGLVCVGIAGGITGEPVDVLIIDDPVEGRAEAESKTYRDAAWDWWESNGSTRLSSRGRVVLMMTRWHEDDLAGRLLKHEPGRWRVLKIPAIADGGADPIGRQLGDELPSVQRRRPGHFRWLKDHRSAYAWRSIYQQDPTAAEGNLFRRPDFRYWRAMPADSSRHGTAGGRRVDCDGRTVYLDDCWRFATIDLAASKRTSADWTVVSGWGIGPDGDLILLDRVRDRAEESEHFELARPLLSRWALDVVFVEQSFITATFVIDAVKAGIPIQPVTADTDKITRSLPATTRVKGHRVWFPAAADWLDDWCDELASFPSGTHDDQVDTFSYAARVAAAHWLPQDTLDRPAVNGHGRGVMEQAYEAATGIHANGTDYMTLQY
jgi:predicted phage terminase large subunit-like protein